MKLLSILFLSSLLLGQIGGISVYPGAVVYIHDILLAILLIEGFVQYAITGKFTKPKLVLPIFLFICAAVLSLLTNSGKFPVTSLAVSAMYLVRWIFYVLVYILVLQIYTKVELWLYGLFSVGVGLGILGLIQFFLYPDLRNLAYLGWDPHLYRLFSTFLDPNFTGIFLILTIFLGVYLWMNKKIRIWVLIGELISMVSLLLTYSRSSFLAFGVVIVMWAVAVKQWKLILGLVLFAGLVLLLPKPWGETLSLTRIDSSLARVGNWQESLGLIMKAPIFGYGFNTLRYVRILPWGPFFSKAAAGFDSSILFVLATTGVVGLAAGGYLIVSMIRQARISIKHRRYALLGMVYLASLGALGIHSLFVNSAFYPWVMIWFWILTGVVERLSNIKILASKGQALRS